MTLYTKYSIIEIIITVAFGGANTINPIFDDFGTQIRLYLANNTNDVCFEIVNIRKTLMMSSRNTLVFTDVFLEIILSLNFDLNKAIVSVKVWACGIIWLKSHLRQIESAHFTPKKR